MASTTTDRFRKKPRLSPSAASTTSHRVKNGVASARPQYAFGSRLPLTGKENVNSNTLKPTVVSHSGAAPLKNGEKDSQTTVVPASAMKNRLKRPRSATNASNEAASTRTAMPSGIPAPQINVQTSLSSSKATSAVKTPPSEPEVESVTTENEPEAEDTTESVEEKKEEESEPTKETEEPEDEPVESLFDTSDASRAGFWKQRQAFVLTAMKDMQTLQQRLSAMRR